MAGTTVRDVLKAAKSLEHQYFSATYGRLHRGVTLEAYCAAFVRWCFKEGIDRSLPIVRHPDLYRRLGLSFVGGELTADGLAGDAIGPCLPQGMQPGDILLFRNTYGSFPYGTITHVAIAAEQSGMMYDAGSGSRVWLRSVNTFPGKLAEVRRPKGFGAGGVTMSQAMMMNGGVLGGGSGSGHAAGIHNRLLDHATRIHFDGSALSAKLQGHAVRNLDVQLTANGSGTVNQHGVRASLIELVIQDANGRAYKLFKHDGKCQMMGMKSVSIKLHNGLLEVAVAGGDSGTGSAATGKLHTSMAHFAAVKPKLVELTILH